MIPRISKPIRAIGAGLAALSMLVTPAMALADEVGTTMVSQAAASSDFYGATAQPFQIWGEQGLRNIKVVWGRAHSYDTYQVERKIVGGDYQVIASAIKGNTFDDYGLKTDTTYQYRVSVNGKTGWATETNEALTKAVMPDGEYSYRDNLPFDDNSPVSAAASTAAQAPTDTGADTGTEATATLAASARSCSVKVVQTKASPARWAAVQETCTENGQQTVRDVLTGDPTKKGESNYSRFLYDAKLEGVSQRKNPQGKTVINAHWERSSGYSAAEVIFISGTPGENDWKAEPPVRPQNHESRDATVYTEGKDAYMISSTYGNRSLQLYKLNDTWTGFVSESEYPAVIVSENQHREAPAIIKKGNYYYLFTSGAAGWYPTQTKYISAKDDMKNFKTSDTMIVGGYQNYGTQSGYFASYGAYGTVNIGYRYGASWDQKPEAKTTSRYTPTQFHDGYASKMWFPIVSVSSQAKAMAAIQMGQDLSTGKPVYAAATSAGSGAAYANDGLDAEGDHKYTPTNKGAYTWAVDLQTPSKLSEVDLTLPGSIGSETFLQYTIDASNDGKNWTTVADASKNKSAGFTAKYISDQNEYRYVRVNVLGTYAARTTGMRPVTNANSLGLMEVRIYGTAHKDTANLTALQQEIDASTNLKQQDYAADSWTAFDKALQNAKTVAGNAADQSEADNAANALRDARNALVSIIKLREAVAGASDKQKSAYTEESWKSFAGALKQAKDTLDDPAATNDMVSAAVDALTKAESGLKSASTVEPTDKPTGGSSDQTDVNAGIGDTNNASNQNAAGGAGTIGTADGATAVTNRGKHRLAATGVAIGVAIIGVAACTASGVWFKRKSLDEFQRTIGNHQ